jgi:hypothetical protein
MTNWHILKEAIVVSKIQEPSGTQKYWIAENQT